LTYYIFSILMTYMTRTNSWSTFVLRLFND